MARSNLPAADEVTPLLTGARTGDQGKARDNEQLPCSAETPSKKSWRRRHCAELLVFLIFFIELGDYLNRAPWQRLLESILCRKYFLEHDPSKVINGTVEEQLCKRINDVQGQLSTLLGWDITFTYLPSLFLAVPFAKLSDVWGRKKLLLLTMFGMTTGQGYMYLAAYYSSVAGIDLRWMWANNAFSAIGGGAVVALAVFSTMIADVTTPNERTRYFTYIICASLFASLLATPVASRLMQVYVWIPLWGSMLFFTLGTILLAVLIPETLPKSVLVASASPSLVADGEGEPSLTDSAAQLLKPPKEPLWNSMLPIHFFKAPLNVKLLASTYLVQGFARQASVFLLPLISRRFQWSIAKANYFLPLNSITTLVVLIAIIPTASKILITKFKFTPLQVDLAISRTSVLHLLIGSINIALAPVPIIMVGAIITYASGVGYIAAVRAVATALTPAADIASLYAVLAIFDTIGGVLSGYIMSATFNKGLELGGLWTGLPFLTGSVMFLFSAIVVAIVRLPPEETNEDRDGEHDQ